MARNKNSFGPWKQDPFLPHAEKLENWPVENGQRRAHNFDEDDEIGLWWGGAHYSGISPSYDDPLTSASSSTASGGANWQDSDSNGYYNLGDTIIVTGMAYVGTVSGGTGSGGGGTLPPDDTTSIPNPTGETIAEIPGQEPLPTPCVATTFTTQGVSLTDVNRAALAASNVIAGLADHRYEYSSIVFVSDGKIGFTEPYTDRLPNQVNFLGGLPNVPADAVILAVVHNHPDRPIFNDGIPSTNYQEGFDDWGAYDDMLNRSYSRGITIDQNALLYIYTDEDRKTRVYDNTDKTSRNRACSLQ